MTQMRHLAWPAYLTAAALIVFPVIDALSTLWPMSPELLRWRFGAVGVVTNGLVISLAGAVLAFAVAASLGQRLVQQVLAWTSLVVGLVLLLSTMAFALDSVQLRVEIRPEVMTQFYIATARTCGKLLFFATAAALLGISTLRSLRRTSAAEQETSRRRRPVDIVVGPPSRAGTVAVP